MVKLRMLERFWSLMINEVIYFKEFSEVFHKLPRLVRLSKFLILVTRWKLVRFVRLAKFLMIMIVVILVTLVRLVWSVTSLFSTMLLS